MEENKQHFRHTMLYYFKRGKNATAMQKRICTVYGEGVVIGRTYQQWFAKFLKFLAGDFCWMMFHGQADQLKLQRSN